MQRELPVQVSGPENNRGGWILAGALFLALLIALAIIVFLSGRVGDEPPPAVPDFQPPVIAVLPRFEVRSVDGGKAVLVADGTKGQSVDVTRELDIQSARVEVLRPSDTIPTVGQGITIVGVWDQVHNLSIRSIVIHPAASSADGTPVSPAGFRGHEAEIDAVERPVVEGRVGAVKGRQLTITGNGEDVTLTLADGAPLYEIEDGSAADVGPGARLALKEAEGRTAVLVLPATGGE